MVAIEKVVCGEKGAMFDHVQPSAICEGSRTEQNVSHNVS